MLESYTLSIDFPADTVETFLFDCNGSPINNSPIEAAHHSFFSIQKCYDEHGEKYFKVDNLKIISWSFREDVLSLVIYTQNYRRETTYTFSSKEDFYYVKSFLEEENTSEG